MKFIDEFRDPQLARLLLTQITALAEQPQLIMTSFGDAMRVPGSKKACCRPRPKAPTCAPSIRHSTP